MSLKKQLEQLERVAEIATLAGINGRIDEDRLRFEAGFGLAGNRSQVVYVRVTGATIGDSPVVSFVSPCLLVKSGFMSGISKEQALELLRLNEQTLFARFGLWVNGNQNMVVASVDHLLDTLDPEEFRANMLSVATAADAYEQKHGKDMF